MTDLPNKPWFRIGEAATLLGVHENTVRRWLERGYLSGLRTPTGGRRISHASLNDCLSNPTKVT